MRPIDYADFAGLPLYVSGVQSIAPAGCGNRPSEIRMAIITTPTETRKLMGMDAAGGGRRSRAISRFYGGTCPLTEGQKVTLAYEAMEHGKRVMRQYGTAVVRSILEMTFAMRSGGGGMAENLAKGEGFSGSVGWGLYYGRGGASGGTIVHRLQFDDIELFMGDSAKQIPTPDASQLDRDVVIGSIGADDLDSIDDQMFGA